MQLIVPIERQYVQYINRLQNIMGENIDSETSPPKPSTKVFENAKRVIKLLCDMYGKHTHVASQFCVTYEGRFEIILTSGNTVGRVTIDEAGIRLTNGYAKTVKYVSLDYLDANIINQFKKYMKNYL